MPTLNVRPYIEQCLDSVVNQILEDIEIIIVDAGSDDGTLEILNEFASRDSRITILHSDMKSYGHQMNMGIAKANGTYIGIVETDDYIAPEMFDRLYKLSDDGTHDIVKSSFIYVNEDTGKVFKDMNVFKQQIPDDKPFNLKDNGYILTGHPSIWAGIYKRSFLLIHGIEFVEAPGGGWVDNQFFHETACLAKTIRYTDEAYYYYRESNPDSSSNKLSDFTLPIRRMLDNLDVIDKYPECKTEEVLKCVYWRVNIYMDNIQNRDEYEENLPLVEPYIVEMMDRLQPYIVHNHFSIKDQQRYYSFLSPVGKFELGNTIELEHHDLDYLLREYHFFKRSIKSQDKEIRQLKREVRKKNREIRKKKREVRSKNWEVRKYKRLYYSLLNSSSWKITKPLRGFKRIFKK